MASLISGIPVNLLDREITTLVIVLWTTKMCRLKIFGPLGKQRTSPHWGHPSAMSPPFTNVTVNALLKDFLVESVGRG